MTSSARTAQQKIFIGGYTKSGTTFVGRAFGLFNGVYAKGEQDYFRLFTEGMRKMVINYNENIGLVNKEVYDDQGTLEPLSADSFRDLHDKIFKHIFFSGQPVPSDCTTIVEKSPRNIYFIEDIEAIFPEAINICVYREPLAVFRSLMRHMTDHRDANYAKPDFAPRVKMLKEFFRYWDRYISTIEKRRQILKVIQYDRASDNHKDLVDYIEAEILRHSPGLKAPIETLSKEHYLQSLPEEARAKSLVQTGPYKIQLAKGEIKKIRKLCRAPKISFDF